MAGMMLPSRAGNPRIAWSAPHVHRLSLRHDQSELLATPNNDIHWLHVHVGPRHIAGIVCIEGPLLRVCALLLSLPSPPLCSTLLAACTKCAKMSELSEIDCVPLQAPRYRGIWKSTARTHARSERPFPPGTTLNTPHSPGARMFAIRHELAAVRHKTG